MQPSQYINTILVPEDGEIPLDIQCLASQGIFDVVFMIVVISLISNFFSLLVDAFRALFITKCFLLQITVHSICDPKVGIIFDPKSLIQAIADLLGRHMKTTVREPLSNQQ